MVYPSELLFPDTSRCCFVQFHMRMLLAIHPDGLVVATDYTRYPDARLLISKRYMLLHALSRNKSYDFIVNKRRGSVCVARLVIARPFTPGKEVIYVIYQESTADLKRAAGLTRGLPT